MKTVLKLLTIIFFTSSFQAQMVPSKSEGIGHLVTFSKECPVKWGDDDYTQTFFFLIPDSYKSEFYIRIFDPNIGGELDQKNGSFDSKTKFSVYGGNNCFSEKDARAQNPKGNFKSGTLLKNKTFGSDNEFDNKWYAMGPFNPSEGELTDEFGPAKYRVFKVIAQGISGNDGNLYKYYLSQKKDENKSVEAGKAFTYEYSFRLPESNKQEAHLYPFINNKVISIEQNNFDFDSDGQIIIYSVAKNGHSTAISGDGNWSTGTLKIEEDEKGKSLDVRLKRIGSFNNDMVIYMVNQYKEPVPFFASPLGDVPRYKYKNTFQIQ